MTGGLSTGRVPWYAIHRQFWLAGTMPDRGSRGSVFHPVADTPRCMYMRGRTAFGRISCEMKRCSSEEGQRVELMLDVGGCPHAFTTPHRNQSEPASSSQPGRTSGRGIEAMRVRVNGVRGLAKTSAVWPSSTISPERMMTTRSQR